MNSLHPLRRSSIYFANLNIIILKFKIFLTAPMRSERRCFQIWLKLLNASIHTGSPMSLCVGESPTGCLTIVGTSCLEDEYYIRYTLPFGLRLLFTTVLIWVAPLVSSFFVLLWILGITMFIKSRGSLSTGAIWMIMPQVVQALNGFSMHKLCSKNSLKRVLWFSHINVTLLNVYLNLLTKLRAFSLANP